MTNLLDPHFPDQVVDLLAGVGLPRGTLELELTEDLFMADPVRARAAIGRLLEAGVSLVVDDYGTGFSLAGLPARPARHPRAEARPLLRHAPGRRPARRGDRRVHDQPRALRWACHVVAEGVETAAVRDRLAELGCELAQGFFFCAVPLPADGSVDLGGPVRRPRPGSVRRMVRPLGLPFDPIERGGADLGAALRPGVGDARGDLGLPRPADPARPLRRGAQAARR